ncbi:MAG: 50S ribosomal protein L24 [Omnitrophica WOR_2 bacterium SM23_72]|nr:MAG: 50S ribosomal protein L24 [Omnitrophica WOR_2 bacterium SM23_72]
MQKIKKGDIVQVMKGKDAGKKGKILAIMNSRTGLHAIVEGINLVKKHKRQTRQDQQGGIVSIEAPLRLSNLMIFCKKCDRAVRVGFTVLKDQTKARVCKSCKETI